MYGVGLPVLFVAFCLRVSSALIDIACNLCYLPPGLLIYACGSQWGEQALSRVAYGRGAAAWAGSVAILAAGAGCYAALFALARAAWPYTIGALWRWLAAPLLHLLWSVLWTVALEPAGRIWIWVAWSPAWQFHLPLAIALRQLARRGSGLQQCWALSPLLLACGGGWRGLLSAMGSKALLALFLGHDSVTGSLFGAALNFIGRGGLVGHWAARLFVCAVILYGACVEAFESLKRCFSLFLLGSLLVAWRASCIRGLSGAALNFIGWGELVILRSGRRGASNRSFMLLSMTTRTFPAVSEGQRCRQLAPPDRAPPTKKASTTWPASSTARKLNLFCCFC